MGKIQSPAVGLEGEAMQNNRVIAMGGSAGGIESVSTVLRGLPSDFSAPILVVIHVQPRSPSVLPRILSRAGPLEAITAVDGHKIKPGRVYVAPPDWHLTLNDGRIKLRDGPSENGFRPAIDPTFRSVAKAYGPGSIGVILSGNLDDGAAGLMAIKNAGGIAIVQDPETAVYPNMPQAAIDTVKVDHILPVDEIASTLVTLANSPAPEVREPAMDERERIVEKVEQDLKAREQGERPDSPATFTCPDCGGIMWSVDEGGIERYRCHLGHLYSPESLVVEHSQRLEEALWAALRTMEEQASVYRTMAARARKRGHEQSAGRYERRAEDAHERAGIILQAISFKGGSSGS